MQASRSSARTRFPLPRAPIVAILLFPLLLAVATRAVSAYPAPGHRDGAPAATETPPDSLVLLADEQFVSGPLRGEQAVTHFLQAQGSFLAQMPLEPVVGHQMPAGPALALLAEGYSVSPALLLTVAESEYGVLSRRQPPVSPAALASWMRHTAAALSRRFYDHYYQRGADVVTALHAPAVTPNPTNASGVASGNSATYSLRAYFLARLLHGGDPQAQLAAWEAEIAGLYRRYFGPPLAGRLHARHPSPAAWDALPALKLPWPAADRWYLTGGPHHFDGSERQPRSGVDFQPVGAYGCNPAVAADRWVAAAASGLAIDYRGGWVKLDHDGDGDAQTGWQTVYGHVAHRLPDGVWVEQGARLGHPACRGGFTSGAHLHFGVKFENLWQPIAAVTLSGWTIHEGEGGYEGAMTRPGSDDRRACFRPEPPHIDCNHAALTSDNEGVWQDNLRRNLERLPHLVN